MDDRAPRYTCSALESIPRCVNDRIERDKAFAESEDYELPGQARGKGKSCSCLLHKEPRRPKSDIRASARGPKKIGRGMAVPGHASKTTALR